MLIHKEINEKDEDIERTLARLLNLLIEKQTKTTALFKVCNKSVKDKRDLTEGIKILESIQFKSVEDFNSVRKLREAELFFSKSKTLNGLVYSSYRNQINSSFLTYVDIEIQLDDLLHKVDDLAYRGFYSASTLTQEVVSDLKKLNLFYFEEKKMSCRDYKSEALTVIDSARPTLEQHRGYKELLGNLILLILTLGTAFIANKVVNGHFLFFRETETSKQLDKLGRTVATLNVNLL